ncbi:MAG: T9SS type A sorting domain-containing protein [Lewinellaceae bacterium]|nr:T9SS type A sorting domain-containing protein [Saprospiraceae bacterium]MCB9331201.1 T9SS type A sorting domain-containing protein [Lewinellaceae bacterium]
MPNRLISLLVLLATMAPALSAQTPINSFLYNGAVVALSDNVDNYVFARYLVTNPSPDSCVQYSFSNDLSGLIKNFNCNELGVTLINIRSLSTGSMATLNTESYVLVQDNLGVCPGSPGGQLPIVVCRNGLALSLNGRAELSISPDMWDISTAACNNDPDIKLSFSADTTDTQRTVDCTMPGVNLIQIWATNSTGLQNYAEVYYILQDNGGNCDGFGDIHAPHPQMAHGLAAAPGYAGTVVIHAADTDAGSVPDSTDCLPLRFSFSADTNDITRTFTCDDLGTNLFQLWVTDACGRQNYAESYIIITNGDGCDLQTIAPPNDNIADAAPLDAGGACAVYWSNVNATAEANEPAPMPSANCTDPNTWCDGQGAEHSVWFTFQAPASGSAELRTAGMNTQLAVWEQINGNWVLVAANDDLPGDPDGASGLTLTCLEAGQNYWVQIDGHSGAMGQFSIALSDPNISCAISGQSNQAFACGEIPVTPVQSTGTGAWVFLMDQQQRAVVAVNDMGNVLGTINAEFMVNGDAVRTDAAGNPYLDRNWTITVENQPVSPVYVRLLFGKNEWETLANTAGAPTDPGQLQATKVSGASCGDYQEGGTLLMNMGTYPVNASGDLAGTFAVDGFSAFYLHGGAALTAVGAPHSLPLTVFPNPARDRIRIDGLPVNSNTGFLVRMTNNMGQEVFQTRLINGTTDLVLPRLATGLYLLQATDGLQTYSGKLILSE